jgi:hypothetical protein
VLVGWQEARRKALNRIMVQGSKAWESLESQHILQSKLFRVIPTHRNEPKARRINIVKPNASDASKPAKSD